MDANVKVAMAVSGASSLPKAKAPASNGDADSEAKSSYETKTEEGNFWNMMVCSLGRGVYSWSNNECTYSKNSNWRR